MKHLSSAPLKGKHLVLPTNIGLDWRDLSRTKTLAYYEHLSVTNVNRFITRDPRDIMQFWILNLHFFALYSKKTLAWLWLKFFILEFTWFDWLSTNNHAPIYTHSFCSTRWNTWKHSVQTYCEWHDPVFLKSSRRFSFSKIKEMFLWNIFVTCYFKYAKLCHVTS